MSENKTFLGKIIADILSIFKANWLNFIIKIANKIPKDLADKLTIIVKVVENLKKFIDSPLADVITAIIPGEADDKLKEWLRKELDLILNVEYIYIGDKQDYHNIATQLTEKLTGLSYGQSVVTIEAHYQKLKADGKLV